MMESNFESDDQQTIDIIDLNSDLGEGYGGWSAGDDATMLTIVSSANIACGGHASDPETMFKTLNLARQNNVSVGAHPGFNDKEGFGRRRIPLSAGEVERLIVTQIGALQGAAALANVEVGYVKPHGALGNWAAEDQSIATAVVNAVIAIDQSLAILAMAGSALEKQSRARGVSTYSEIFADRAYGDDGQLVSRAKAGAVLHDADEIHNRLLVFLRTGKMPTLSNGEVVLEADSICIHGDNPQAVEIANSVRQCLVGAGVTIQPFVNSGTQIA